MMAAKREMPLGGKRAKMGTGRAREKQLGVWIDTKRMAALAALAEREGVTKTALIERWIDEHTKPLPADYEAPE